MRHEPLDIDPDVRRARALPTWFYRSERAHAWLTEELFARSWQLVAHLSRLAALLDEAAQPGAWPFEFLPGLASSCSPRSIRPGPSPSSSSPSPS